jgi:putative intracellular protease/amidase
MDIALAVFPQFTALDLIGPYDVLARLPGASVRFVAAQRGDVPDGPGSSPSRSPERWRR